MSEQTKRATTITAAATASSISNGAKQKPIENPKDILLVYVTPFFKKVIVFYSAHSLALSLRRGDAMKRFSKRFPNPKWIIFT